MPIQYWMLLRGLVVRWVSISMFSVTKTQHWSRLSLRLRFPLWTWRHRCTWHQVLGVLSWWTLQAWTRRESDQNSTGFNWRDKIEESEVNSHRFADAMQACRKWLKQPTVWIQVWSWSRQYRYFEDPHSQHDASWLHHTISIRTSKTCQKILWDGQQCEEHQRGMVQDLELCLYLKASSQTKTVQK